MCFRCVCDASTFEFTHSITRIDSIVPKVCNAKRYLSPVEAYARVKIGSSFEAEYDLCVCAAYRYESSTTSTMDAIERTVNRIYVIYTLHRTNFSLHSYKYSELHFRMNAAMCRFRNVLALVCMEMVHNCVFHWWRRAASVRVNPVDFRRLTIVNNGNAIRKADRNCIIINHLFANLYSIIYLVSCVCAAECTTMSIIYCTVRAKCEYVSYDWSTCDRCQWSRRRLITITRPFANTNHSLNSSHFREKYQFQLQSENFN